MQWGYWDKPPLFGRPVRFAIDNMPDSHRKRPPHSICIGVSHYGNKVCSISFFWCPVYAFKEGKTLMIVKNNMAFAFGDSAVVASYFGQMDLLSSQEMVATEGEAFSLVNIAVLV